MGCLRQNKFIKIISLALAISLASQGITFAEVIDLRKKGNITATNLLLAVISGSAQAYGTNPSWSVARNFASTYLIPMATDKLVKALKIKNPVASMAFSVGVSVGANMALDKFGGATLGAGKAAAKAAGKAAAKAALKKSAQKTAEEVAKQAAKEGAKQATKGIVQAILQKIWNALKKIFSREGLGKLLGGKLAKAQADGEKAAFEAIEEALYYGWEIPAKEVLEDIATKAVEKSLAAPGILDRLINFLTKPIKSALGKILPKAKGTKVPGQAPAAPAPAPTGPPQSGGTQPGGTQEAPKEAASKVSAEVARNLAHPLLAIGIKSGQAAVYAAIYQLVYQNLSERHRVLAGLLATGSGLLAGELVGLGLEKASGVYFDIENNQTVAVKGDRIILSKMLKREAKSFFGQFAVTMASQGVEALAEAKLGIKEVGIVAGSGLTAILRDIFAQSEAKNKIKAWEGIKQDYEAERNDFIVRRDDAGYQGKQDEVKRLDEQIKLLDSRINYAKNKVEGAIGGYLEALRKENLRQLEIRTQQRDNWQVKRDEKRNEFERYKGSPEGAAKLDKELAKLDTEVASLNWEINRLDRRITSNDYQISEANKGYARAFSEGLLRGGISVGLQKISLKTPSALHGAYFNLFAASILESIVSKHNFGDIMRTKIDNIQADVYSMGRAHAGYEDGKLKLIFDNPQDIFFISRYNDYIRSVHEAEGDISWPMAQQFISSIHQQNVSTVKDILQHLSYKAGIVKTTPLIKDWSKELKPTRKELREAYKDLEAIDNEEVQRALRRQKLVGFLPVPDDVFIKQARERLVGAIYALGGDPAAFPEVIGKIDRYLDLNREIKKDILPNAVDLRLEKWQYKDVEPRLLWHLLGQAKLQPSWVEVRQDMGGNTYTAKQPQAQPASQERQRSTQIVAKDAINK